MAALAVCRHRCPPAPPQRHPGSRPGAPRPAPPADPGMIPLTLPETGRLPRLGSCGGGDACAVAARALGGPGGDGLEAVELAIRTAMTRLGCGLLERLLAADTGYRGP